MPIPPSLVAVVRARALPLCSFSLACLALGATAADAAPADGSCEVGHVAPDWTPASWAALSPTADRCLRPDASLAKPDKKVYLCGGLSTAAGGHTPAPFLCPSAPGGLVVGRGEQPGSDYRRVEPDRSVVLDCPGRYAVLAEGSTVSIVLEEAGAGACKGLGEVRWGFGSTGAAVMPFSMGGSPNRALLPPSLQGASTSDWFGSATEGSGSLVWEGGAVPATVGGFALKMGTDAEWNDVHLRASGDMLHFSDVAIRLQQPLVTTPAGQPVELGTWARGWFDAEGGGLESTIPIALPEARACGVALAPGGLAALQTEKAAPGWHGACRKKPTTPPELVLIGPTWVALEWELVPEESRSAEAVKAAAAGSSVEVDLGCELVCRVGK